MNTEWIICPICQSKTRLKIWEDTMLENFPLYCPKCKQETLINILMVGRITIVAAHRFSTIKNADKIIMRGHISGRGSHEELIKNNSLHQELLKIQVKGYETN